MKHSRATVRDVLEGFAKAFSQGDLDAVVQFFCYPYTVYAGTQKTVFADAVEAARYIGEYRANLLVEAFREVKVTLLHERPGQDGFVQVLVAWDFLNRKGATIVLKEASHFLRRDAQGEWCLVLSEFLAAPATRFSHGVPMQ